MTHSPLVTGSLTRTHVGRIHDARLTRASHTRPRKSTTTTTTKEQTNMNTRLYNQHITSAKQARKALDQLFEDLGSEFNPFDEGYFFNRVEDAQAACELAQEHYLGFEFRVVKGYWVHVS